MEIKLNTINVYDSVRPIFICSKFLGLCSFSISSTECSKTVPSLIYSILVTIFFTTHSLSELSVRENEKELLIYVLTDYFHTYAGVICAILIYWLSMFFRDQVSTSHRDYMERTLVDVYRSSLYQPFHRLTTPSTKSVDFPRDI